MATAEPSSSAAVDTAREDSENNAEALEERIESTDESESSAGEVNTPPPIPPHRYYPGAMPRPNCTHIVMDYFYTTEIPCDSCGYPPRLGWLYVCQQDHYSEAIARRQIESLNQINDKEQVPSRVEELQACGMSRSIIDQVKQGNVSDPFQIEVLKNQKINMLRVMDQQLSHEHEPWNISSAQMLEQFSKQQEPLAEPPNRNVTMRSSVRVAKAAAAKIVQKLGHFRRRSQVILRCSFKCCHACRPYLRDRAFIPLGGAVQGDIVPEKFALVKPPISNLIDVENLGLRPAYQPRFLTRQDSSDEDSMATSLTPSTDSNASYYEIASEPSATTPENWSVQLDHANQVIDGPEDESQTPSRRSPSYSDKLRERAMPPGLYQTARSSEAEGGRREGRDSKDQASRKRGVFKRMPRDIGGRWFPQRSKSSSAKTAKAQEQKLRHWSSHHNISHHDQEHPAEADLGLQSSTSSTDASSAAYFSSARGRPLTRDRFYAAASPSGHSSGHPSPRSDTSQASASSDEVPVEGGVALTEEAVETLIPDIITQA